MATVSTVPRPNAPSDTGREHIHIHVVADAVHDNGNGTFTLKVPGRPISQEAAEMLDLLFPNLLESAYKLLHQETLIQSIATPSQINAPKKKDGETWKSSSTPR